MDVGLLLLPVALAGAACGLGELWIAKPSELQMHYLQQYFPDFAKAKLKERAPATIKATLASVEKKA